MDNFYLVSVEGYRVTSLARVSSNKIKDIFYPTRMMYVAKNRHIDNGDVILRKQLWIIVT